MQSLTAAHVYIWHTDYYHPPDVADQAILCDHISMSLQDTQPLCKHDLKVLHI
jgi:hypothetical protein